ncbi:hypothetical protein F7725_017689 [Dissostichus mawsoni]|uniref:PH domain-containing protein n=1 Tax=Dissostichus mawsoni TaxID=36200 RepID=A0A7J5XPG5_DISMA|nr:hypothetical protein F7725_017689 [Dissostichus mawsoni]
MYELHASSKEGRKTWMSRIQQAAGRLTSDLCYVSVDRLSELLLDSSLQKNVTNGSQELSNGDSGSLNGSFDPNISPKEVRRMEWLMVLRTEGGEDGVVNVLRTEGGERMEWLMVLRTEGGEDGVVNGVKD